MGHPRNRRDTKGGFCTACTRRLKTETLLFGEGACLVWHRYVLESGPRTEKTAKCGKYLSHLPTASPWVGRLHAVLNPPRCGHYWFAVISGLMPFSVHRTSNRHMRWGARDPELCLPRPAGVCFGGPLGPTGTPKNSKLAKDALIQT